MWQYILFVIFLPAFSFAGDYNYSIRYIDVPVDHFSFTTNATFKLRYLYNESYWTENGPIFFYTGNEGDIETFAQNTGFMWEIAPEFGALLVFAEHRYYGKSLPFGNDSFSDAKHLGYLTSAQAMADYIFLIGYLQNTKERTAKLQHPVIAFGGSYGGMLAAWIRQKYPATILGSISSSAPILQFGDLVPCNAFNKICTEVYKLSSNKGADCSALIKRSWRSFRKIASTDEGKTWLSTEWNLCEPLKTDNDTQTFIDWLTEIYGNVAMVNYPYPTNFLATLPGNPVRAMCNHLTDMALQDKDLIHAIFNAISVYTNYTGTTQCNDVLKATPGLDAHMWDFQACSEMVMPMCSTTDEMFEEQYWNLTIYSDQCYKKWGVRSNADLVLDTYGGARVSSFTNVVFSNGLLDPWSAGGVTSTNTTNSGNLRARRSRRSTLPWISMGEHPYIRSRSESTDCSKCGVCGRHCGNSEKKSEINQTSDNMLQNRILTGPEEVPPRPTRVLEPSSFRRPCALSANFAFSSFCYLLDIIDKVFVGRSNSAVSLKHTDIIGSKIFSKRGKRGLVSKLKSGVGSANGSTTRYFRRPFVVIMIPGAAHHLDLRASNPIDPIAVKNARIIHRSEIRRWLDTYYTEE